MDVVLVGLPGSGKSAVGRRLTARHDARFIDLDETIENAAGGPDPGDLRRPRASRASAPASAMPSWRSDRRAVERPSSG